MTHTIDIGRRNADRKGTTMTITQAIGMYGTAVENGYDITIGTQYVGYVFKHNGRWFYETAIGKPVTKRQSDGFETKEAAAEAVAKRMA